MVRSIASALAVGALLAAAAPAAASVTIGSSLRQRANLYVRCPVACTELQTARPGNTAVKVAADGVIVRWRLRSATLGKVRLRIMRLMDDGTYATVGAGDPQQLGRLHRPGEDVLYTFPARIRVRTGDAIALDHDRKAGAIFHSYGQNISYAASTFSPQPDDATPARPESSGAGRELLLSADIERDVDGDWFGDETQDNCPTIANDQTANPCPTGSPQAPPAAVPGEQPDTQTIGPAPVPRSGGEGPPASGEPPANRTTRDHDGQPAARPSPTVVDQDAGDHARRPPARHRPARIRRDNADHQRAPAPRKAPARQRRGTTVHRGHPRARRPPRRAGTKNQGHRVRQAPRETPIRGGSPDAGHRARPAPRPAPDAPSPPGFRSHRPRG